MLDITTMPVPVEAKRRTITLTNRAPIKIIEEEWPVIGLGVHEWEHPAGADHGSFSIVMRVRQEKSLFAARPTYIIHAKYDEYDEDPQGGQRVRVGRRVDDGDLWRNMVEVGDELRARITNDYCRKLVVYALDACFASLPPQPI